MDKLTEARALVWTVANQAADQLRHTHHVVRLIPNAVTGIEAQANDADFPAIRLPKGAATVTIQLIPTFNGHGIDVVVSDNDDAYSEGCLVADLDVDLIVAVYCKHQIKF